MTSKIMVIIICSISVELKHNVTVLNQIKHLPRIFVIHT
jgi:hypothetical protein